MANSICFRSLQTRYDINPRSTVSISSAITDLYRQKHHSDSADTDADPLPPVHFLLEHKEGEDGDDRETTDTDYGVDEARGESCGREENDEEVVTDIECAGKHGSPPSLLQDSFEVTLVTFEEDDREKQNGKNEGEEHQHIAVLATKDSLLGSLDNGASRVSCATDNDIEYPFERNGALLLLARIKTKEDGKANQNQTNGNQYRDFLIPKEKSPDGNQNQGKVNKEGGQSG